MLLPNKPWSHDVEQQLNVHRLIEVEAWKSQKGKKPQNSRSFQEPYSGKLLPPTRGIVMICEQSECTTSS
jgi:hypothetical protein